MSPRLRLPVLLLLAAGIFAGGWWLGKNSAAGPAQRAAHSATAQLPPPSAHPPGYLSTKATPAPPAAGAEALAKLLEQRAKPEDLAAALAAWAEQEPDAAFRALLADPRLQSQATARALFEVLGKNDPAQALQRLAQLPAVTWARDANIGLATGWTQRDPQAATAAGLALPPGLRRIEFLAASFTQWTKQDFIAAKAWYMALPPEESHFRLLTLQSAEKGEIHNAQEMDAYLDFGQFNSDPWGHLDEEPFKTWLKKSPEAALQWALALPQDGPHTHLLLFRALDSVASDPARVLSLLPQLKNLSSREHLVTSAAEAWAQRDPTAAWAWATQLNSFDFQSAFEKKLTLEWTTVDPATAIPWLLKNQPAQIENMDPAGLKYWATATPDAALGMLGQLPPMDSRQGLVKDLLEGIATTKPTLALSQLDLIQAMDERQCILAKAITTWCQLDVTAATSDTNSLPPGEDKQTAIRFILEAAFKEEPASALTWATTLTNPQEKRDYLINYLDNWRKQDPAAAQNWLDHAPLDDALRQKLTPSQP